MGNNTNNTIGHSKKRARATTDHTPRPSNSFMIYRREKQAEILAQYRGQKALHNNAISKVVADMWREESPEVRAEYAAKAEAEKLQHMIKYPGYKYTPRR
ncbi:high mobility group box domain-containing protein, partial [Chytriomyces sp. MP71]